MARGLEVFKSGTAPACVSCHAVKGVSTASIGPDLSKIGAEGGNRKPGVSADVYVRESIVNPSAFVVSGYAPLMPPDLAKNLSSADLEALIVYLLSLK